MFSNIRDDIEKGLVKIKEADKKSERNMRGWKTRHTEDMDKLSKRAGGHWVTPAKHIRDGIRVTTSRSKERSWIKQ